MAPAAPSRGRLPGVVDPASAANRRAFLADCGVPLLRHSGLRNDAARWERLFTRLTTPHVADLRDPVAALALLQGGYRPSTRMSYMSKFRGFLLYCDAHDCEPLPATTSTIVGYILWEQQCENLTPPSVDKNLSAVRPSTLSLALLTRSPTTW